MQTDQVRNQSEVDFKIPEAITATNREIIVIRHAEKHNWVHGQRPTKEALMEYKDNHLLSCKGKERAHALVPYFTCGFKLRHSLSKLVFQESDRRGHGLSKRPKDTLIPLYEHLTSLKRDVELVGFTKNSLSEMAEYLLSASCHEQTVLVSWSHQQIPLLMEMLGVDGLSWDKTRFDVTWVLTFENGVSAFKASDQRLLFGDI